MQSLRTACSSSAGAYTGGQGLQQNGVATHLQPTHQPTQPTHQPTQPTQLSPGLPVTVASAADAVQRLCEACMAPSAQAMLDRMLPRHETHAKLLGMQAAVQVRIESELCHWSGCNPACNRACCVQSCAVVTPVFFMLDQRALCCMRCGLLTSLGSYCAFRLVNGTRTAHPIYVQSLLLRAG